MCKICLVENCNNKHYGKGYCHKHYQQFRKHGRIIEHESEEAIEARRQAEIEYFGEFTPNNEE